MLSTTMWLPLSLQGELRRKNLLQGVLHRDNVYISITNDN